jgi:hypothetical protein
MKEWGAVGDSSAVQTSRIFEDCLESIQRLTTKALRNNRWLDVFTISQPSFGNDLWVEGRDRSRQQVFPFPTGPTYESLRMTCWFRKEMEPVRHQLWEKKAVLMAVVLSEEVHSTNLSRNHSNNLSCVHLSIERMDLIPRDKTYLLKRYKIWSIGQKSWSSLANRFYRSLSGALSSKNSLVYWVLELLWAPNDQPVSQLTCATLRWKNESLSQRWVSQKSW